MGISWQLTAQLSPQPPASYARASSLCCGQQRSCSKQSSRERKGSEGSSTRAAWRLQRDYRALGYVNPFTISAQLKGWLEAGKAEVALKGLWHKAKPRGAYGPKGAGRWPHHLKEMARIVCKNGTDCLQEWHGLFARMLARSSPLSSITSCIRASVCACTLASVFCTC
jgi:hypothetical protein